MPPKKRTSAGIRPDLPLGPAIRTPSMRPDPQSRPGFAETKRPLLSQSTTFRGIRRDTFPPWIYPLHERAHFSLLILATKMRPAIYWLLQSDYWPVSGKLFQFRAN